MPRNPTGITLLHAATELSTDTVARDPTLLDFVGLFDQPREGAAATASSSRGDP